MKQELKIDNRTIVFAGGGTGGHVWPLVALVRSARRNLGVRPIYFGTGSALERRIWRKERVKQVIIPSGKVRNYRSIRNLFDPIVIGWGVIKAIIWLLIYRPALIIGKGSYGMLPTALAARLLKIAVISHESDIVMGRANKMLLGWGNIILTAFPTDLYDVAPVPRDRLRYVGMPIHPGFYDPSPYKSCRVRRMILVFGGSQGAERINKLVASVWDKLTELGEVVQVTGTANYRRYKALLQKQDKKIRSAVTLHPEVDNLPKIISEASVIICRGGSTSLWEVIASETPAVVIPLPEAAGDHQRLNALWLSQEFSWLTVLEEKNLMPSRLIALVKSKLSPNEKFCEPAALIMPNEALAEISTVIKEMLVRVYLSRSRYFFLIGDMGVSMQGIGTILRQMGHKVAGSDIIRGGHKKAHIVSNIDAVIYSSAAATAGAPGGTEIDAAKAKNIPVIKRSKFIQYVVNARKLVAVSGMHGKSTTASMISCILAGAGRHPSYLIGIPSDKSGAIEPAHWDKSGNIVVVEACEYDRSFCDFPADIAVVTNIEREHLDYFTKGLPEIERAFTEFIEEARPSATLVLGSSNPSINNVAQRVGDSRPDIRVVKSTPGKNIDRAQYQFFGDHNFADAAVAVRAAHELGVEEHYAWEILKGFSGAGRRMQYIGKHKDALVYDDYGHHPTEIKATLDALREKYPKRKLYVVFQPHQVSRTKSFLPEFAKVLSMADKVIVTDIYEVAGRDEEPQIKSEKLVEEINKLSKDRAQYVSLPYSKIVQYIENNIEDGDLVLTLGATNIYRVARGLVYGKVD